MLNRGDTGNPVTNSNGSLSLKYPPDISGLVRSNSRKRNSQVLPADPNFVKHRKNQTNPTNGSTSLPPTSYGGQATGQSTSSLKPPSTSQQASRKILEPGTYPSSGDTSSQKTASPQSVYGLKFDSNFECGNLEMVREKEANVYDIIIRNDANSAGHIQWFYFRVRTPSFAKGQLPNVKFNILNLTKKESLFEQGMKVTILSKKSSMGWIQGGNNISYTRSSIHNEINYLNSKQQTYHCLAFEYKFEYSEDEVFFAYTLPYTYTMMQRHLLALNQLKELKDYKMLEVTSIGRSNGHLDMPLIKIKSGRPPPTQQHNTQPTSGGFHPQSYHYSQSAQQAHHHALQQEEKEDKPVIFIIGRQHPGETFSSFIIHGLINFLLTQHPAVLQLREMFDFWIMPIANPDGVILGNYRCNLQGKDLNRCFQFSNDEEYGGTYSSVKECECIQTFMNQNIFLNNKKGAKVSQSLTGPLTNPGESRIKLFLDIHTHSSQRGIFAYAPCAQIQESIKIRSFPQILDDVSQYFRLASCKYQSEKTKRNCARLAFVRDYKAEYSYTIEASSYAYVEKKTNQTYQLKEQDLLMFGRQIVQAIAKLFLIDPNNGSIVPTPTPAGIAVLEGLKQVNSQVPPIQQSDSVIQQGPKLIGYNLPLDFGLRRQWRPPLDLVKLVKSVQSKFIQPRIVNPLPDKPTLVRGKTIASQPSNVTSNTQIPPQPPTMNAQEKRNQFALKSGGGNRSDNTSSKLENRLSDASRIQNTGAKSHVIDDSDIRSNLVTPGLISSQGSPPKPQPLLMAANNTNTNSFPLTRGTTQQQSQHKEPMKIKSSVFQMAYSGELLIAASSLNDEISLGAYAASQQPTPTIITNDIISKILKQKQQQQHVGNHHQNVSSTNNNAADGVIIKQNQKNNLIAYSQKVKNNELIGRDLILPTSSEAERQFVISITGYLDEPESPFSSSMKSKDLLTNQIKKVQNHKLNKQGNRTRFLNFGNGSPMYGTTPLTLTGAGQAVTVNGFIGNNTQTFRSSDSNNLSNAAFPELSQLSQTQQMIVPAKLYQKNTKQVKKQQKDLGTLLRVPNSHTYAQPTLPIQSRSERPPLPANHSIGEKTVEEDEISTTHEAIPIRDFDAPDLLTQGSQGRLLKTEESPSKLNSKFKKAKFQLRNAPGSGANTDLQNLGGISQGSTSSIYENKLHPSLKKLGAISGSNGLHSNAGVNNLLNYSVPKRTDVISPLSNTLYGNNSGFNNGGLEIDNQVPIKARLEGPSTGQLQSKLELIEQKSRDFKEYLKIQLQEVHENHMKDKYPYNRINQQHGQAQGVGGPQANNAIADTGDNHLKSAAKVGGAKEASNITNQHHLIKYEQRHASSPPPISSAMKNHNFLSQTVAYSPHTQQAFNEQALQGKNSGAATELAQNNAGMMSVRGHIVHPTALGGSSNTAASMSSTNQNLKALHIESKSRMVYGEHNYRGPAYFSTSTPQILKSPHDVQGMFINTKLTNQQDFMNNPLSFASNGVLGSGAPQMMQSSTPKGLNATLPRTQTNLQQWAKP